MTAKRLPCPPKLDEESGRTLFDSVRRLGVQQGDAITVDFAATENMDSRGGAWLVAIADYARARQSELRSEGQQGQVAEFIEMIEPGLAGAEEGGARELGFLETIGDRAWMVWDETRDAVNLIVDALYWTVLGPLQGKGFRGGLLIEEMFEMGVRAVPIVCLMNFLLGITIAMLSAAQVAQFGLQIFIANLVIVGFARELAAVMTAVVVSARTGAAIAAEIATMKVQEEIDALRGMGLNVSQFLIAPKLLALLLVTPCLVTLAMISGIAGGAVWGVGILDIRASLWFNQTLQAATLKDISQGLVKGLIFAAIIALVGCHNGLRVQGGSRGVGLMTTRAVVMDIFFIVVVDMVFAAIFYYALDRVTGP